MKAIIPSPYEILSIIFDELHFWIAVFQCSFGFSQAVSAQVHKY